MHGRETRNVDRTAADRALTEFMRTRRATSRGLRRDADGVRRYTRMTVH
jgi:hypothetical protein